MSRNEQYRKYASIAFSHESYPEGGIPVSLFPTHETQIYLRREEMIFRPFSPDKWILLTSGENPEKRTLHFDIRIKDTDFHYYTSDIQDENTTLSLYKSLTPGIWRTLEIRFPDPGDENNQDIHLHIKGNEKYFEYLLIPQYNTLETRLKLTETTGSIPFEDLGQIILPDRTTAIRFRSKEKIPLKNFYSFKTTLWEIRNSGDRLLSENIPPPSVTNISVFSPADTITSYFYF